MGVVNAKLTDQEKILARIALIVKGLSYAQGDLEKTIGGYANATRRLAGEWKNLQAEMGGPAAGMAADAMAGARLTVSHPGLRLFQLLGMPGADEQMQKIADKQAGVNSKEMTAPAKDLRTLRDKQLEQDAMRKAGDQRNKPSNGSSRPRHAGRSPISLKPREPLKDALSKAAAGPLGNVLGGLIKGGVGGAVMAAAKSGLGNAIAKQLIPRSNEPIASHILGSSDYNRFAQERVLSNESARERHRQEH